MQPDSIPSFVREQLHQLDLVVSDQALLILDQYLKMLLDENTRINLTAVKDYDTAWRRLIIDSLTVLPWLEQETQGARLIDIGTGGGLPGLPIAICRTDLNVTLLDSTGKKIRFIERCIADLQLQNVTAVNNRAELLGQDNNHRQQYHIAVSRAIGSISAVLEYSLPLVKVGGRVLAMKGPKAQQELEDAGDALDLLGAGELAVYDAYPESFDNELVIICIQKDRPTPRQYPRPPGLPQQSPL